MEQQNNGTKEQCNCNNGTKEQRNNGTVTNGTMEQWNN